MSVFDNNIKNYPYEGLEELYEKYDCEKFSTDPLYCIKCLYEIVSGGHQPSDFLFDATYAYVGTEPNLDKYTKQSHSEYLHTAWERFNLIKKLFNYPTDREIRMALFTKTFELTDEQMKGMNTSSRYVSMAYIDFQYVHI